MFDQLEKENCFTIVTLAADQTTVGPISQTIFAPEDVVVTRDGQLATYATAPTTAMQYKLVYKVGVQGFRVIFGQAAAGGEKVVIECDIEAYRLAQFPVTSALPIAGLNNEQNFLARAIQSAARWEEILGSFMRFEPGTEVDPIPLVPNTVIFVDENGDLVGLPLSELASLLIGMTLTPEALAALLEQVVIGPELTVTDNGDGTATFDVDMGGDLLLLEGDQQSGAGGGGSQPFLTLEDVMDYLGGTGLVEGSNVNWTYDDVAGTLTLDASTGGLTEEQIQDMVATFIGETSPLTATYDDVANTYTLALSQTALKPPSAWQVEVVPLNTAITTGIKKKSRAPFGMTLTGVRASLGTAQVSGGLVTVDVKEGGVSIFGVNKLTFDNGQTTTTTATTGVDLSDTSLADDAEISWEVSGVGDGTAKGLVVTLLYQRT